MSRASAKETVDTVARLSVEAFAQHELTAVRPGLWKCARPQEWVFGFFVATMPGAIALYGDTPDALLRVYPCGTDESAVAWLRGSTKSPGYLLGKVTSKEAWREFYPDDALVFAKELAADEDNEHLAAWLEEVTAAHARGELHQASWAELAHEHDVDDVYDVGTDWNASARWVVEAFRAFIRLHDAVPTEATAGDTVEAPADAEVRA